MNALAEYRVKVNRKLGELSSARQRVRLETDTLEALQDKATALKVSQALAQSIAQQIQEEAHRRIADVVSRSLEAVFDDPYAFQIIFEQKRGRTEASLVFDRKGLKVDPTTASGGGVVDVAAFALRLSCLMLSRPPVRRLLVLDEPFKFVSAEYRDNLRDLVETLAKEMDCQFLIVTHLEELRIGKVVEL